jgi:hypothetical protein
MAGNLIINNSEKSQSILSSPTPNSTQLTLCSQFFGPLENCREIVWGQLIDFGTWQSWSSKIDAVERKDTGNIGRGSVFSVTSGSIVCDWQIVHWHPGMRVDFVIPSNGMRIGYSFLFSDPSDGERVELQLNAEFEFLGIHQLFSGFLRYRETKIVKQLFDELISHIETVIPLNS